MGRPPDGDFANEIFRRQSAGEFVERRSTVADDGCVPGYRFTHDVPINCLE